jgi:hypothetical protein
MTRRDFGAFLSVMLVAMTIAPQRMEGTLKIEASADCAHHIRNRRLFDFASGRIELAGGERNHLHVCQVCQTTAYEAVIG